MKNKPEYCWWCEQPNLTDEKLWIEDWDPQNGDRPTCLKCAMEFDRDNDTNYVSKHFGMPWCKRCFTLCNHMTIWNKQKIVRMNCKCGELAFTDQVGLLQHKAEDETKEEK